MKDRLFRHVWHLASRNGRLLLRHAMKCAQTQNKFEAVYSDNPAPWKALLKHAKRLAVIRVIECGHKNKSIRDIEIRVASRKSLTVKNNGRRHWELYHAKRFAGEIACVSKD